MSITSTFTFTVTCTGGNEQKSANLTQSLTDCVTFEHATTVSASSSVTYTETIDVSQVKFLFIKADGVITFKGNDDGTPDVTIVLASSHPVVWDADMGTSCPLGSVDLTSIKFTNATAAGIDVYFLCAQDPA